MISIVHELRRARGGIKKLAILRQYENNEEWKEVLKAMYDTSINYYVSAPNENTFIDEAVDVSDMLYGLSELSDRTYTGNAARAVAREYSQKYGEIFRLILDGSLKAGISITTINKAYPGLIPTFPVMLAKDVEIARYPMLASTKYDGVRVIAFVHPNGRVDLKTRAGKKFRVASLEVSMMNQTPGVYDGELVEGGGKQAGRSTITGAVNKCLKGTATDISIPYTYCIFDYVPMAAWSVQQCSWDYTQRLTELNGNFVHFHHILIAEQTIVDNQEHVDEMFADRLSKGYEGLIVRAFDDPYVWGRSDKLIKKKATKECTLRCYDTVEGTGKYEGMIGSLVCAGKIDDKEIRVKVGSGLSDFDRDMPSSHYVGQDIEILYNDVVKGKDSRYHSLFLPRFKRIPYRMDT